jgi:YjbE family integral membrane protein
MEFFNSDIFTNLLTIILLDLVLAGDNALVIAMAASRLPKALQKKAVFWGAFGAVAVRFALTAIVVYMLKLPGLMLIGGILLLPIAWKLLSQHDDHHPDIHSAGSFWSALRTIVIADALMGLDNVLAIAGASNGHLGLIIIGLLISVPLVVWGSTLILKLIQRFPIIMYFGAGAIALTAGRMIAHDHLLSGWFNVHHAMKYAFYVMLLAGICGGGWLVKRQRQRTRAASNRNHE